MVIEYSRYC